MKRRDFDLVDKQLVSGRFLSLDNGLPLLKRLSCASVKIDTRPTTNREWVSQIGVATLMLPSLCRVGGGCKHECSLS